jgi:hypothetical protein
VSEKSVAQKAQMFLDKNPSTPNPYTTLGFQWFVVRALRYVIALLIEIRSMP